jgi:hypothetical protein
MRSCLQRIVFSVLFTWGRSFFQSFLALVDYSYVYAFDKSSLYTYVTGGIDLMGCPLFQFTLPLNSAHLFR